MKCEILQEECNIPKQDCSKCKVAEKQVKESTEEYLARNNVLVPNFDIIKSIKSKTITTVWFQNPIAEVYKGKLKVVSQDL